MEDRKINIKKLLTIITAVIVSVPLVLIPIVTVIAHEIIFNRRFDSEEWNSYDVSDFESLTLEECEFNNYREKELAGYRYSHENSDGRGVVVFAHGLGGGHTPYLPIINYIASAGYYVFAYDATGCGESEGSGVRGLPQGVADLDAALCYVKDTEIYRGLPVMLVGHSWGAYSVGGVLGDHPEVQGAVMLSGFDNSMSIVKQYGEMIFGFATDFMASYVAVYEYMKFGEYADISAIDSMKESDAEIMIIHSGKDDIVFSENGYDLFYSEFKDDDRFTFLWYEERTHGRVFCSDEASAYITRFESEYEEYLRENGLKDKDAVRNDYYLKNIDKDRYNEIDTDLLDSIIQMFNEELK